MIRFSRCNGHSMARSQDEATEKIEEMVLPIAVKLQSKESYKSKGGGLTPQMYLFESF